MSDGMNDMVPQPLGPDSSHAASEKAMSEFLRSDSNYQTTSAWVNGRDAWRAAVRWMTEQQRVSREAP